MVADNRWRTNTTYFHEMHGARTNCVNIIDLISGNARVLTGLVGRQFLPELGDAGPADRNGSADR